MARTPKIPKKWLERFKLIPGYDPVATAAPGEWFDAGHADHAVQFFENQLHHIEGDFAEQKFKLRPDQIAVTGCIFGWKRADGTRRYREVFIGEPRGNGKSPWMAGVANYLTFCDGESGLQGYIVACDIPQAALSFRHLRGQIDRNEALSSLCDVHESYRSVTLKADPASVVKVVSSDAPGKHGAAPHFYICEELHAWQGRALMEAIESSFAKKARKQPMLIYVTTRDMDRPSVCNEKWEKAEQVRKGNASDSSFLPVIFAMEAEDDWHDEKVWEKANPGLDITVDRVRFRQMVNEADRNPAVQNTFIRLHLNGPTQQDMRVIDMAQWNKSADTFTLADMRGQRCFVGLDLSSKEDLTSVGLVFPLLNDNCRVMSFSFCPEERVKTRNQKGTPYQTWCKQEWLTATTGTKVDYRVVRSFVRDLRDEHGLEVLEVCYDPWGASGLEDDLGEDGFVMTKVPQSLMAMSPPTKEFLRRLGDDKLRHDGNPVLKWAASNAGVHYQGKLQINADVTDILDKVPIMFSKQSSADKIDPIVSIVLAFKGVIEHPETWGVSVYANAPEGAMVL